MAPAVFGVRSCIASSIPCPICRKSLPGFPVVVADYDASPMSRKIERDLDATQGVRVAGVTRNVRGGDPAPGERRDRRDRRHPEETSIANVHARNADPVWPSWATEAISFVDGTVLETTVGGRSPRRRRRRLGRTAGGARRLRPALILSPCARRARLWSKQPLFNTVQGYDSYVVSASMGLVVHQLLVIAICMVVGTWVEGGPLGARNGKAGCLPRAFVGMLAGFWLLSSPPCCFWIGFAFLAARPAARRKSLRCGCLRRALRAGRRCRRDRAGLLEWASASALFRSSFKSSFAMLFLSGFALPGRIRSRALSSGSRICCRARRHPRFHRAQSDGRLLGGDPSAADQPAATRGPLRSAVAWWASQPSGPGVIPGHDKSSA